MLTAKVSIVAGLATAGALCSACSTGEPARTAVAEPASKTSSEDCPLSHVRGVAATMADAPGGEAIVFEGPDRALDLLRANVLAMAAANGTVGNPYVVCPCREPGAGEVARSTPAAGARDLGVTSMQGGSWTSLLPPVTATVTETPHGATLILSAVRAADENAVRFEVRRLVSVMGGCLTTPAR
jgi:hypothetical protein